MNKRVLIILCATFLLSSLGCLRQSLNSVIYDMEADSYYHKGADVKLPASIGQFERKEKVFPVAPNEQGSGIYYVYDKDNIKAFSTIIIYPWIKEISLLPMLENSTTAEIFNNEYDQIKTELLRYYEGTQVSDEDYQLKRSVFNKQGKKFVFIHETASGYEELEYLYIQPNKGWMIKIRISHLAKHEKDLSKGIDEYVTSIEIN